MKNQNILTSLGILVAGIFVGFLIFGGQAESKNNVVPVAMHQMPDGSMMSGGGMEDMMKGMMSGLEGKTGDAFDKEFLAEMIIHHQGAVEMAKAVLVKSKRPELIKLANDIISAQNKEIGMMQEWQKAWYK